MSTIRISNATINAPGNFGDGTQTITNYDSIERAKVFLSEFMTSIQKESSLDNSAKAELSAQIRKLNETLSLLKDGRKPSHDAGEIIDSIANVVSKTTLFDTFFRLNDSNGLRVAKPCRKMTAC